MGIIKLQSPVQKHIHNGKKTISALITCTTQKDNYKMKTVKQSAKKKEKKKNEMRFAQLMTNAPGSMHSNFIL